MSSEESKSSQTDQVTFARDGSFPTISTRIGELPVFRINEIITTAYPESTLVSYRRPRFIERRFRIRNVRDLVQHPLTIKEFLNRPMVRRSRYLVSVLDLDLGRYRKIYQRSMHEHFRETPLRVGLFDKTEIHELFRTNWGPTVRDRMMLVRFLTEFQHDSFGHLRIGVFSDDLEVIL